MVLPWPSMAELKATLEAVDAEDFAHREAELLGLADSLMALAQYVRQREMWYSVIDVRRITKSWNIWGSISMPTIACWWRREESA